MILYVESSAVLAWLLGQARGDEARRALRSAEALVSSSLTLFECDRALRRAVPSGLLAEPDADRCLGLLARAASRWRVAAVDDDVLLRGRRPFPREPVRSLDAIHLATALHLRPDLPGLGVLTLDERIASNAELLGFPVEPRR